MLSATEIVQVRVKRNSFFVFLKLTLSFTSTGTPNSPSVLIVSKYGSSGTLGIEIKRSIIYGRSLASTVRQSVLEQNTLSQIGHDGSSAWRVIIV